jgi:tripartite-type tricarboxylate transporter receptor subunit TctC
MTAYLSESRRLDMTHVPYNGEAPMIQDLIGGQIALGFGTAGTLLPQIASGRLRAIAVTGPKRFPDLPDVQTMAEAGLPDPEFRVIGGILLLAPAATPAPVLARLDAEACAAVQSVPVRARMQIYGLRAVGGSAEQARQACEDSTPLVAELVKVSGVKME